MLFFSKNSQERETVVKSIALDAWAAKEDVGRTAKTTHWLWRSPDF